MKCWMIKNSLLILTLAITLGAQSIGNPSSFSSIAQTALNIKPNAGAGEIVGWNFTNTGNATCYIQFFNATAANVSVGSTVPYFAVPIQTTNVNLFMTGFRIPFSVGMSIASATTATGNTGCNANPAGVVFYH